MSHPSRTARRLKAAALCGVVLTLAASVGGQAKSQEEKPVQPPATARSGFSLTVYSTADPASFDPKQAAGQRQINPGYNLPGYGVVRETRKIALSEGANTIRFTDVAAGIDPTTVSFVSQTDPAGTSVVEQDYEFDLVGADKLLQKYIGETITVQPKGQAPFKATLLAAEPGNLVLREGEGQVRLIPRQPEPAEISLPALPSGLITKPTLVWKLNAAKGGDHDVRVSYQTDGITWRADYNLILSGKETALDLGAWVTILNESGASYPDATLKLVAGDVQRVQPPQPMYPQARMMAAPAAPMAAEGFEEKAFFEYHLYTLGRPTSLADRSTKQIELFPSRAGVPVAKTYVYYGLDAQFRGMYFGGQPNPDRDLGTQSNTKVDVYLELKNDEEHGMGMPLPAGRIRVYKRDDADGAVEFVGEDIIQHTPKNEDVRVKLGTAFDIVGERKQTNFQANVGAHWIQEQYQVTLRNQKDEPVKVIVKENLFRGSTWEIVQASDPFQKEDSRTVHFPVNVPAGGSKTVTYTVRYTW